MRNKQILSRWMLSLASFFLFAGCGNPAAVLNEVYSNPREIWGEWIRTDNGHLWRFGSNWRTTDGIGSGAVIKKQSENVIKITEAGKTDIYLFASRLPTASFSGKVAGVDETASSGRGSRAISGLGGMPVIISNVNDRQNNTTAQTDAEGNYTANGIVAGDEYDVTVGNETARVAVNTNGDDVGTITIVPDGVNFKTTLERRGDSANLDMNLLWPGFTYYFNIVIENTGNEDCLAPTYRLDSDSGIRLTNTETSGRFTTIEPGASKKIPVEISCFFIDGESENKKINITIDSVLDKRSWEDSVSLKFNKEWVYLNIRSDDGSISDAVSGIIIVPGVKAYSFSINADTQNPYKIHGLLPKYYAKDYIIVFSGASAATETFYSFSLTDSFNDAPSLSDFTDITAGEENDTEADATLIDKPEAGFRAYLHKNDIDFYRFSF
jgi:hypothetical protein